MLQVVLAVVAVLGPLGVWLAAVKRFSGKISTTEASRLWEAQEKFRADLTARNEFLRGHLDACEEKIGLLEARIDQLETRNNELYLENGELRAKIIKLEGDITGLREQLAMVQHENERLKRENTALKKRVLELEKNGS